EPYALQAKFPFAFLHVHYARGCSLAEAFYQSVYGPYQLLIVGDPLCRPWARIPIVTVAGVEAGATVRGKIDLRPGVKDGAAIARFELFIDGRRRAECAPGESLAVDTTALPDGYHELRVVAITADVTETQGRAIIPIEVQNHGHRLSIEGPPEG